jgi:serine/threonine-protein kinase
MPQVGAIPAIGEVVSGKYRVDGTAGTGGMGVVLSATHVELGHRVAIKVLAREEETDSRAIERFMREGKAAASLQSDHVVRIYDVGRLESGVPFMVMELLRGEDLGTYVGSRGPVEASQAVDWILQACNAIAEAHASGIIHRDLKPANLFLTQRSDGSDCVKVLDFGISKQLASADASAFQSSLTATRQVVGSPAYMSPEQVRNSRDIDHRVDIWALGMTLYEFLSGRPAFCADTFPAVCAAIVADNPTPLHELAESVPKELSSIVLKCLEKEPARRFKSVVELATALLPFAPMRPLSVARSHQWLPSKQKPVSEPTSATLASAHSPKELHGSGSRGVDASERNWPSKTLISDGTAPSSSIPPASRRTAFAHLASKRSIWLILGVVGFAAGVIWKLQSRPAPAGAVPTSTPVIQALQFTVRFESEPAGAEVWEGNRLLGPTPLEYSIEHASVQHAARIFSVRANGYLPFTIKQADSSRDVVLMARLTREPIPLAPTVASTAPVPRVGVRAPRASSGGGVKTAIPQTPAPATLPDDIRLQR